MLGAEGSRRLVYPEGCLDFPELAGQRGRSGGKWHRPTGSAGPEGHPAALVPAGCTSSFHLYEVLLISMRGNGGSCLHSGPYLNPTPRSWTPCLIWRGASGVWWGAQSGGWRLRTS